MPFDTSPTENLGHSTATIYNNGASIVQGSPPPYVNNEKYSSYPCLSTPNSRYVYWVNQNLLDWFNTDNDFTFEYYIMVTAVAGSNQWFDYGLEVQQGRQWVLYNENFYWGMSTVGQNSNYSYGGQIQPTENIKANTWNHIAVCRFGDKFYHFFNGKLYPNSKDTSDAKFYSGNNCTVMLGSINNGPQSYYKNLRISNICRYTHDFSPERMFYDNTIYSNIKTS